MAHVRAGRYWAGFVVVLGLLLSAACGGGGGQPSGSSAPAGAGTSGGQAGGNGDLYEMEITVTHWPSLMYGVPYMVAMEKGFFEQEGIKVTGIVGSEGGGTTVRNVLTGGLPFGEVATPAAIQAYLAGAPIVIVGGGLANVDEIMWVAKKGSGLNGIRDLVGKKVGFTNPGSVTEGTLNLSFKRASVDIKQVERIAAGGVGEGLTALEGGGLDAVANMEPIFSARGGEKTWDVVFWARDFIPWFQQTVIITSPQMIKENPDVVRAFLRARQRAIEFIREHPDETAKIYAKYSEMPEEATRGALQTVNLDTYFGIGFNAEGLKAVEEEMHLINLLPPDKKVPWHELINQDFLPENVERIDLQALGAGD